MTLTATLKHDPTQLADPIRVELRPIISRWSQANPERIITVIPASSLQSLKGLDEMARMNALGQLENYVGAALPVKDAILPSGQRHDTPIASPYELHPMPLSGVVQVVLRTKHLTRRPIRRLADEVAFQAHNYAQKFTVDEVFRFTVMSCIIERVERMSPSHKANFRATLNRRLVAVGLSAEAGTVYAGLEIRRNR